MPDEMVSHPEPDVQDFTRHFEVGYDRDYVGAGLHCSLCPTDPREDGDPKRLTYIAYGEWAGLSDWIALAARHMAEAHP